MGERSSFSFSDIEPLCLLRRIWQSFWMVILAFLIFAMGTSLFCSVIRTPIYQADLTYAVTSKRLSYTSSLNNTAAREVSAVFAELIESDMISDSIRASSPELADFDGTFSASQVGDSNFIVVQVTADSPEKAFLAITALAEQFPALSDYISENASVTILRNPSVSDCAVNTIDSGRISVLAGLAGAVLMIVILCAFAVSSETIQTRSGARHLLDSNVIATVCHERHKRSLSGLFGRKKNSIAVFSPTVSFSYTEAINAICTQLEHEKQKKGRKIFLVTSVGANEGKSTIAGNIAAALAMGGGRVALLDTDFRNPSQNAFFGGIYRMGMPLNQMLAEPFSIENLGKCVQYSPKYKLYMMFSKRADEGATELLTGKTLPKLLRELSDGMDYVIIDSPPMGIFPDAEVLSNMVDASVLVVRQDKISALDINDAVDTLNSAESEYLGIVLNDMLVSVSDNSYGYGYGYGHKYGYGNKYGYGYGYGSKSSHKKHAESSRSGRKEEKSDGK